MEKTNSENFEQRQQSLTAKYLDLLQEQLDLPGKIGSILLKIKDYPIGTKEGDSLRVELQELESRNRTIHLSIQENLEELKNLNLNKKSLKKAA